MTFVSTDWRHFRRGQHSPWCVPMPMAQLTRFHARIPITKPKLIGLSMGRPEHVAENSPIIEFHHLSIGLMSCLM